MSKRRAVCIATIGLRAGGTCSDAVAMCCEAENKGVSGANDNKPLRGIRNSKAVYRRRSRNKGIGKAENIRRLRRIKVSSKTINLSHTRLNNNATLNIIQ